MHEYASVLHIFATTDWCMLSSYEFVGINKLLQTWYGDNMNSLMWLRRIRINY